MSPNVGIRRRRFARLSALGVAGVLVACALGASQGAAADVTRAGPITLTLSDGALETPTGLTLAPIAGTLPGTIDAAGRITIPAAAISFVDFAVPGTPVGDVSVSVVPTGDFTGTVNPDTGAMTISGGFTTLLSVADLGANGCPLGPVTLRWTTAPVHGGATPYNPATGAAVLVEDTFFVPAIASTIPNFLRCGALLPVLNSTLMLPSAPYSPGPPVVGFRIVQPMAITPAVGSVTTTTVSSIPSLSVNDVTVTETDKKALKATFTVSLSQPAASTVKVKYATANGSATAPGDYQKKSGTLTFPAGTTSKTVAVTIKGDTAAESNETFTVGLNTPSGATIGDGSGLGTITDNDPVTIDIGDAQIVEGNAKTQTLAFVVTISRASDAPVKAKVTTTDGSATQAGNDYKNKFGSVTVKPGQTSAVVEVVVNGDTVPESDETFTVTLSDPTAAVLGDASATGTITDDDGVLPT
ncbi:MAG: Calx-beta domain-containing protein [Actinomycetota bacterium]|nr:Calx-beta domain-containing protein [Actinomycetota bacterium]